MKFGLSRLGLALAGPYFLFVTAGLALILGIHSLKPLASLFLLIGGLPWSFFIFDVRHLSEEPASLLAMFGVCGLNAGLLYLAGAGLGFLFSPPVRLPEQ